MSHNYHVHCGCRVCCQAERQDEEADELQETLLDSPTVLSEGMGEMSQEQWDKAARFLAEGDDLAFCNLIRQCVAAYVDEAVEQKADQMGCGRKEAVLALMNAYEVKAKRPAPVVLPWRDVA